MRFGSSGKSFGAAAFRHYGRTAGFLAFIASGMSFPYNLASAQIYSITDLGTLGGGTSEAWGINTQGDVVGRAQIADGRMRAFVSPAGGSMINLGTLAGSVGNWSIAFHINDLGQISGDSSTGTSFEPYHAILYTGGVMSNLGTLGGRNSQGFSINKDGIVVGGADITNTAATHGYFYLGGVMTDVGTLGGQNSDLRAINEGGVMVGSSNIVSGPAAHAIIISNGTTIDIGTLGGNDGIALGINNNGKVVGTSLTLGASRDHAFLYSGGTMQDLGTLGGSVSAGWGINDSGLVVGSADPVGVDTVDFTYNGEPGGHAFLWKNGTMLDLNTLLSNGSGWTLTIARAINAGGQIVGVGKNPNGQSHAFLLTPTLTCAGTPGVSDCVGKCVSTLAEQFQGLPTAAADLGYPSVQALLATIRMYCRS